MQVVFGTKNDLLIINGENDLMTIRTFIHKWFNGETSETTVTFPISSLARVELIKPTIFKRGKIIFSLDDEDFITKELSMAVQYKNKNSIARLVRDLQHQIDFT